MPTETILRTNELGKRYQKRWAVRDLALDVKRGEVFGFLGPNGAGKSTTIRMMLSLVRPTTGCVELFGMRLDTHRAEALRRVGGLVEQADFYLHLSARRNLEIVGALYGGVKKAAIDHALEVVGLVDRSSDKVKRFSHGMKQRLGIAQALLSNPELVLLDEPTTGLDPQGIVEVRDLIVSLARDHGITVLLSSHLLNEIEQSATSMAIINRGKLVVQGQVRDLLSTQRTMVELDARPIDRAASVLGTIREIQDIIQEDGRFRFSFDLEQIPHLIQTLVADGIAVHAVTPKRSLEDFFLRITAEAEGGQE